MTTRRKAAASAKDSLNDLTNSTKESLQDMQHPSQSSPFLPTKIETLLLLIYPTTLVLGSIFSQVAPFIRASSADYNGVHQSYYPPSSAPSYFAQKRNVFNVYFVKKGWFWVTVALAIFVGTHPSLGPSLRPAVTRRRVQAAARWGLATLVWAGVTQWFFGPPLIDRSFRLTGGACELVNDPSVRLRTGTISETKDYFTATACKIAGGQWKGGHDISGHVFLLILGSALLWFEVLPAILKSRGLREERRVRVGSGKVVKTRSIVDGTVKDEAPEVTAEKEEYTTLGVKISVGVVALSWWMLLMTAAFFHTWFEKFTGFLVAFVGIFLIYFLPRGVPEIRAVLGMPGL
jgi:hypothetical protein